ncbi:hypothetical protein N9O57_01830, partial [bacterium]|nr:hypothetical protein [bacterium]
MKRIFQNESGISMIGAIMVAASMTATMMYSLSQFYPVLFEQKRESKLYLDYSTVVNGFLDYMVYATENRWCLKKSTLLSPECQGSASTGLTPDQIRGLVSRMYEEGKTKLELDETSDAVSDFVNLELLLLNTIARNDISGRFNGLNFPSTIDNLKIDLKNIDPNELGDGHPVKKLFTNSIGSCVKGISISAQKDNSPSRPASGSDTFISFNVSLDIDSGFSKSCGRYGTVKGKLLAVFAPISLAQYALIKAKNRDSSNGFSLDKVSSNLSPIFPSFTPPYSYTNPSGTSVALTSYSGQDNYTGEMNFYSPVYMQGDFDLGRPITSPKNISFHDIVYLEGSIIHQDDSGVKGPYSQDLTSVEKPSQFYHFDYDQFTSGAGFKRGVSLLGLRDAGLDYLFGYDDPSILPLDLSLMKYCAQRAAKKDVHEETA